MLVELPFMYGMEYVPERKRKSRREYVRSKDWFEIDDVTSDAVKAYEVVPLGDAAAAPAKTIYRTEDGACHWPLERGGNRGANDGQVAVAEWLAEREHSSFVEWPWQTSFGDPLDVREMLEKAGKIVMERPGDPRLPSKNNFKPHPELTRTYDEAAPRKVMVSTYDMAMAHMRRAAARLTIVDGMLYRRGGEPAIAMSYDVDPKLTVVDAAQIVAGEWRTKAISGGPQAPLPFNDFEIFRADRIADVERRLNDPDIGSSDRERKFDAKSLRIRSLDGIVPEFDATRWMNVATLGMLHACLRKESALRGLPPLPSSNNEREREIRASRHLLAKVAPDIFRHRPADAIGYMEAFKDILRTLRELPNFALRKENLLYVGRWEDILEQAVQRNERDIANGVAAAPTLTGEETDAIAALTG